MEEQRMTIIEIVEIMEKVGEVVVPTVSYKPVRTFYRIDGCDTLLSNGEIVSVTWF